MPAPATEVSSFVSFLQNQPQFHNLQSCPFSDSPAFLPTCGRLMSPHTCPWQQATETTLQKSNYLWATTFSTELACLGECQILFIPRYLAREHTTDVCHVRLKSLREPGSTTAS